jgi:hypothetical protein
VLHNLTVKQNLLLNSNIFLGGGIGGIGKLSIQELSFNSMKILLPEGITHPLYRWHIDNGIHPNDPNLRITKCGIRYLYGGPMGPQVLRNFYCPICR